jgi:hypothetical protein
LPRVGQRADAETRAHQQQNPAPPQRKISTTRQPQPGSGALTLLLVPDGRYATSGFDFGGVSHRFDSTLITSLSSCASLTK